MSVVINLIRGRGCRIDYSLDFLFFFGTLSLFWCGLGFSEVGWGDSGELGNIGYVYY